MNLKKLNTLKNHQGFMKYFYNTSWLFAEQLLRMIAGVFVGIWVARYLGPEQFGIFSYALAFAAIFSGISKLGLDNIVVRDLVNQPDKRDRYLGTAFWLKFIGALITLAILAFASLFTANDDRTNLYIFIIASGTIFQSFEVIDFYFQSKVLSKYVSLCKITQLLLSSALKLYVILTADDLFWFVIITLIDQATLAIALCIAYKYQRIGSFYRHFNLAIAKTLINDSWPMIFSSIVVMLYMRIDQIIIKQMLGEKAVGLYSAAVRLSEVGYFIPMIITSSLFPAIISAKKISETLYYARLQRLYTLMVWIAITIALPMTFLSDWLVIILYGETYKDAGQVLIIHIWTSVFVFLGVASGSWLTSENLQHLAFYRTFLGMVTNIILNFVLIPIYGLIGSAIATIIAQMVAAFIFDIFSKKTRIMFFMKLKTLNVIKIW
jgi:O-antigen/teichoic acid export membrane protein